MPLLSATIDLHTNTALITEDEAHHLIKVLRVRVGEKLRVTDGQSIYETIVTEVTKHEVVCDLKEKLIPPPPPFNVHLYLALIKPDKIEWVIEKAVELNIAAIHLIITEFTTQSEISSNKWERFKKIATEAQKQCERIVPLILTPPVSFLEVTENLPEGINYFCEERLQNLPPRIRGNSERKNLWIGPEGGWHTSEKEKIRDCGMTPVTLGPLVLRAETAAIAAMVMGTTMNNI